MNLFFEIVQVALGVRNNLSRKPSEGDWTKIFEVSKTQSVIGLTFYSIEKLSREGLKPPSSMLYEWIGISEQIRLRNLSVNKNIVSLFGKLNDEGFECCLLKGYIIKACKWLKAKSQPKERIAGWDLFSFEMNKLERKSEKCKVNSEKCMKVMFMGSSEKVLSLIREKAAVDYPNLEVITYSPPYKPEFSNEDNAAIIKAINDADPDLLWIGMTAPKQEKWTYSHWKELDIHCHVGTIGAVFDFYAGTAKRAPMWWQEHSLEWLYRLIKEPKRMWRRYVIGNPLFLWNISKERV